MINWIFEKNLFDEYEEKFVNIINNNNDSKCLLYDNDRLNSNFIPDIKAKFKDSDIVFFYGSLQLAQKFIKNTNYYPGCYLTIENYDCSKYYGYYGNDLLNNNYFLISLNDLKRRKNEILNFFNSEKLFIRPNNGVKSFTGQIISKSNFDLNLNTLMQSYGGLDNDLLVVLSDYKELKNEYRLVIVDNKIISGSLYLDQYNRESYKAYYDKLCLDEKVYEYAETLLSKYEPDRCYTMDICETITGEYKLLEINSFCCASMYGNDLNKITKAINEMCLSDYNDIYL
jgi:hypothetical protein